MITDAELLFSDEQTINAGNIASTSHVDALAAGDAISPGARVVAKIAGLPVVDAAGGTIVATLQTCAENTFGAPTTLLTGPTITIAAAEAAPALGAGAIGTVLLDAVIPAGVLQFLRVYYTNSVNFDSGKVDARIVLDSDKPLDKGL